MKIDAHGWLIGESGDRGIVHVPTVRTTRLASDGPLGIVWHATGGVGGPTFAASLAARIATYRKGVDRPASWHVCIAQTGVVFQSAPLSVGTWHVGRPGWVAGRWHPYVNTVTIGVELENAGQLFLQDGGFYAHPFWLNGDRRRPDPKLRIPADRVTTVDGRHYAKFTTDQYASAVALVVALTRHRRWGRDQLAYCHSDFAAPRKVDPGALWKTVLLPRLLDEVFALRLDSARDEDVTLVTPAPYFDKEASARAAV